MKLVVIILNFRTAEMTVDAIKAVLAALADACYSWAVTVVDNDSGDGSEEKLRSVCDDHQQQQTPGWDHVEIVQSGHNGGFGAGNNVGIRHAFKHYDDLEYIYILNSDAFPAKSAIATLVDFLDQNQEYGYVGSYIHGIDGEPHVTAFRFPSILSEFASSLRLGIVDKLLKNHIVPIGIPEASRDVDWLAGASFLMRVETIRQVGLFDETFFLYFEETDLCKRAAAQGWKTRYILESKVAHVGSASTGMKQWERIPGYWLDSRRHYFTKNHGRWYFWLATLLKLLGHSAWILRCSLTSKVNTEPRQFGRDMIVHTLSKPDSKTP